MVVVLASGTVGFQGGLDNFIKKGLAMKPGWQPWVQRMRSSEFHLAGATVGKGY